MHFMRRVQEHEDKIETTTRHFAPKWVMIYRIPVALFLATHFKNIEYMYNASTSLM